MDAQSLCLRSWHVTPGVDLDIGDALTHGYCKGRLSFLGAHGARPITGQSQSQAISISSLYHATRCRVAWSYHPARLLQCVCLDSAWLVLAGVRGGAAHLVWGFHRSRPTEFHNLLQTPFPAAKGRMTPGVLWEAYERNLQRGSGQLDGQCHK